jgi:hypothetical protein
MQVFLPIGRPIEVAEGDEIRVSLRIRPTDVVLGWTVTRRRRPGCCIPVGSRDSPRSAFASARGWFAGPDRPVDNAGPRPYPGPVLGLPSRCSGATRPAGPRRACQA